MELSRMSMRIASAFFILWLLLSALNVNAFEANGLASAVSAAQKEGIYFRPFVLFNSVAGERHTALASEALLIPDKPAVGSLYKDKPAAVSITLYAADGSLYQLHLLYGDPLAANANFGYIDLGGMHRVAFDQGVHYQGVVNGDEHSFAALSVFANGEVMAVFGNSSGNFVLGKLQDSSGRYILYNDRDFLTRQFASCGVDDRDYNVGGSHRSGEKTTASYICKKVQLYWEADYQLYQNKGSLVNTQNYLTGLFNVVQALYKAERIAVELKSLYVWTMDDGYADTDENIALANFTGTWNNRNDTFDGDLAHLIALDAKPNSGLGYVDVLCNRPYSYAYSDVTAGYQNLPAYSWDVEVLAHETGHNLGAQHTHWCGWNTGTGGTCGSIDNCATQEPGSSCSSCSFTFDNAAPTGAWSGTIMSNCAFVSRGVLFANGFGQLPGDKIRGKIGSSSCLKSVISATLTAKPVCRNDGGITLTFDGNNFGTAPYTFYWSNNTTGQNIANLNAPGNFSVFITDSNGCSITYAARVERDTTPGCFPANIPVITPVEELQVYPNPASTTTTISFYAVQKGNAITTVRDIFGRIVLEQKIHFLPGSNNTTLDISDWSKGIYILCWYVEGCNPENIRLVIK